jgi:hypothetical protein
MDNDPSIPSEHLFEIAFISKASTLLVAAIDLIGISCDLSQRLQFSVVIKLGQNPNLGKSVWNIM